MKRICYDSLPYLVTLVGYNHEVWEVMTPEMQKKFLLELHEKLLTTDSAIVKLLNEMEKE